MGGMASTMRSMRGMLLGLGLPLAIGALTKSFLDFEKKMAHVRAVADDFGRSATGMRALTDAALSVGQAYGFTAVEVAEAQEALLKAGRSTAQVLGGELNAALTLAAAGTISLDEAATTTAVTMTIFKDEFARTGAGATEVANQLVGAANETVSGVQEMGTALSYVGPVAASLGISFRETVATISVFNQAGIEADRAGTNLRGMLTNLLSPSAMARAEMIRLGVDLNDSEGNFVGLANAAQILHDRIGSLGARDRADAIGRLTTNASMPGFIVLMQGGAKVVKDMERAIRESATAEEVAAEKLDSVTGALNKFTAATSSAAIKVGGALAPALEGVAKSLTSVATGFGNLGGAGQLALLALAAQLLMARRLNTAFTGARSSIRELTAAQVRLNQMTGGRGTAFIGPLGRDGTAIRTMINDASTTQRVIAQTRAGIATATTTMERFRAVGVGAMQGIAGAGRGLVSFLGGPWGVALAGVMAGFVIWQAEQARIQRLTDNLRSGINLLGLEYARTGQVAASSMREMFKSNSDMAWVISHTRELGVSMAELAKAAAGGDKAVDMVADKMDSYADRAAKLADEFFRLSVGQASLHKAQRDQLGEMGVPVRQAGWIGGTYYNETAATAERLQAVAERAHKAADAFRAQRKEEMDLIAAEKELANTMLEAELERIGVAAEDASEGMRMLAGNLATMNSPAASFSDRIKAMAGNIDLLTSAFYSAASAQSAFFASAQEGLADAFNEDVPAAAGGGTGGGTAPKYGTTRSWDEDVDAAGKRTRRDVTTTRRPDGTTTVATTTTTPDGKKTTETRKSFDSGDIERAAAPKTRKVAPKLDAVTGQFDTADAAGRKQHEAMAKMVDSSGKAAEAIFTQTALAGGNTAEAMHYAGAIATAEFIRMREEATAQLTAVTGDATLAKRIIDEYFPSAKKFAEGINAKGADELVAALKKAGIEVRALSLGRVALVVEDEVAARDLATFGGKLQELPDGRFKVVYENQDAANKALDATLAKKAKVAKPVPLRVKPDTYDANLKLRELDGRRILLKEAVDLIINLPTAERAAGDLSSLIAQANRLDRQNVDIDVNVIGWAAASATLQAAARQIDELDLAQYGLRPVRPEKNEFPSKGSSMGPHGVPKGRFDRWGGFHPAATGSLRDAMIAGPGTRYQWAEPETGGEAFVPRHGKHDRSMGILSKAAAWYGAKVTPASTGPAWGGAKLQPAGGGQVNITVRGEGVLSGMIEATVDGRLVKVAQTVANRRVR
jgi:TP901 family phage tail tape measure protein